MGGKTKRSSNPYQGPISAPKTPSDSNNNARSSHMSTDAEANATRAMAYRANFLQASKVKDQSSYLVDHRHIINIKSDIFIENKYNSVNNNAFLNIGGRIDFKPNFLVSTQLTTTQKLILDLHQKYPRVMANHADISKKIRAAMTSHEADFEQGLVENKCLIWRTGVFDNPIIFALIVYENARNDGMTLSDMRKSDPLLYKHFTAQCYYLGLRPRSIFELIDESMRQNKAQKAVSLGLIQEDVVRCPKKSEIGNTISEEQYRQQLREYGNQLRRVKKAERRDPQGRLYDLRTLNHD